MTKKLGAWLAIVVALLALGGVVWSNASNTGSLETRTGYLEKEQDRLRDNVDRIEQAAIELGRLVSRFERANP